MCLCAIKKLITYSFTPEQEKTEENQLIQTDPKNGR